MVVVVAVVVAVVVLLVVGVGMVQVVVVVVVAMFGRGVCAHGQKKACAAECGRARESDTRGGETISRHISCVGSKEEISSGIHGRVHNTNLVGLGHCGEVDIDHADRVVPT